MRIRDLFSMAFTNLWRRKLRTALTVLGVVIGCASIIIMVSFGLAQQKQLEDMTGSTEALQTISVRPTAYYDPSSDQRMVEKGLITDDVIKKIESLDNVESVTYFTSLDPQRNGAQLEFSRYSIPVPIGSATENYLEELEITEGRVFDEDSNEIELIVSNIAKYMVMPQDGDYENFDHESVDLVGAKGKLILGATPMSFMDTGEIGQAEPPGPTKTYRVRIVGEYKGSFMGGAPEILMPQSKVEEMNKELADLTGAKKPRFKTYQNLIVSVKDTTIIDQTTEQIKEMDLEASNDTEFIETMNQGMFIMQAILGGIGGIALVVAAIGITNSMVMSVYERTKEIGVMKVIGASVSDIRNLFLLEAGMMGLLGGIVGVIISLLVSLGLNNIVANMLDTAGQQVSIITPGLALAALVICFLIGLVTGYYPAVKATKMSALEAMRT